jgi:hypothetical protein
MQVKSRMTRVTGHYPPATVFGYNSLVATVKEFTANR